MVFSLLDLIQSTWIEYLLTVHKKLLLNSYANFLTLLSQTECLIDMWLLDNKNFSYPDQFVKSIIACQTWWGEFGKKEFGKNVKHVGQKIKKIFPQRKEHLVLWIIPDNQLNRGGIILLVNIMMNYALTNRNLFCKWLKIFPCSCPKDVFRFS